MPGLKKFNKTSLEKEALPLQKPMSGKDQKIFWDTQMPGFGLKVSARRAIYVTQKRVGAKTVRVIIGAYAEFATPDEAREKARDIIRDMRGGTDVNLEKKAVKENMITLLYVLNDYLQN